MNRIWADLFAIRDDDGLDATGLREVFDGFEDLSTADVILLESGSRLLFESGDRIALEAD